jgi:hypothetical protein
MLLGDARELVGIFGEGALNFRLRLPRHLQGTVPVVSRAVEVCRGVGQRHAADAGQGITPHTITCAHTTVTRSHVATHTHTHAHTHNIIFQVHAAHLSLMSICAALRANSASAVLDTCDCSAASVSCTHTHNTHTHTQHTHTYIHTYIHTGRRSSQVSLHVFSIKDVRACVCVMLRLQSRLLSAAHTTGAHTH